MLPQRHHHHQQQQQQRVMELVILLLRSCLPGGPLVSHEQPTLLLLGVSVLELGRLRPVAHGSKVLVGALGTEM
jgi:hypothetical protein